MQPYEKAVGAHADGCKKNSMHQNFFFAIAQYSARAHVNPSPMNNFEN
jgi:hypothetical protein